MLSAKLKIQDPNDRSTLLRSHREYRTYVAGRSKSSSSSSWSSLLNALLYFIEHNKQPQTQTGEAEGARRKLLSFSCHSRVILDPFNKNNG